VNKTLKILRSPPYTSLLTVGFFNHPVILQIATLGFRVFIHSFIVNESAYFCSSCCDLVHNTIVEYLHKVLLCCTKIFSLFVHFLYSCAAPLSQTPSTCKIKAREDWKSPNLQNIPRTQTTKLTPSPFLFSLSETTKKTKLPLWFTLQKSLLSRQNLSRPKFLLLQYP
jgi:hypothetical protein